MAILRFWFSAVFRTRVTFDSSVLEWSPEAARDAFAHAARRLAAELGAPCGADAGRTSAGSEHRYATLSQDADQQFVTPVLDLQAPTALCDVLVQALQARGAPFDGAAPRIDAGGARVALFDNTVGLLEWSVALDCGDEDACALFDAIDQASFDASAAGVAWIQREMMLPVVRAIDAGFRRFDPMPAALRRLPAPTHRLRSVRRLSRALRRPREATAFFDMPAADDRNGLMWVSRVLRCHGAPGLAAREWAGVREIPAAGAGETRLLAGVGNSLAIEGTDSMADVATAYRKLQYLYALLDIHGRNITRLSTGFLARRRSFLARTLQRLDRIQAHLGVVESRAIDVFAGLQGARARHCAALSQAWDLPGKERGVHRKAAIAHDMVAQFAQRQGLKYQKMVQFILAVVGVLALADVVINLTAFAHAADEASAWGIVKVVRAVPPDTLLTGTGIVLAVAIVILGLLFRRG